MNSLIKKNFLEPKNMGILSEYDIKVNGNATVCGDLVTFYLSIDEDNQIIDAKYQVYGCTTFIAACSILSEKFIGESINNIIDIDIENIFGTLVTEEKHVLPILERIIGEIHESI